VPDHEIDLPAPDQDRLLRTALRRHASVPTPAGLYSAERIRALGTRRRRLRMIATTTGAVVTVAAAVILATASGGLPLYESVPPASRPAIGARLSATVSPTPTATSPGSGDRIVSPLDPEDLPRNQVGLGAWRAV